MAAFRRIARSVTIGLGVALAAFLASNAQAGEPVPLKVGAVTRHAEKFVGQHVLLVGYLLARESGYIFFSDEARGRITRYDLPVAGPGLDQMAPMKRYLIEGEFLDHGLAASNGSPYHLELSTPPRPAQR